MTRFIVLRIMVASPAAVAASQRRAKDGRGWWSPLGRLPWRRVAIPLGWMRRSPGLTPLWPRGLQLKRDPPAAVFAPHTGGRCTDTACRIPTGEIDYRTSVGFGAGCLIPRLIIIATAVRLPGGIDYRPP